MSFKFAALPLVFVLAGCVQDRTAAIPLSRAEQAVRQACPAFRNGDITVQAARAYGGEQITNYQNGSRFACRCVVANTTDTPRCNQVAVSRAVRIEP